MLEKAGVRYLDKDVLTAAKERLSHVFDTFDRIFVSFSGGKDSLVVLELMLQFYRDMGWGKKLDVIFRDEELIPDDVIRFVQSYREHPGITMHYYAVPLKSEKFILGRTFPYIQWDPDRRWIRPKPEFAITDTGGHGPFDQYTMDAFCMRGVKGKIALMTGVRADESLVRFRSCVNKRNENYINATDAPNIKLVKPIYDWTQKDVFKFFLDNKILYCPIYDLQVFNKQALRVATPLHSEQSKQIGKYRTLYPVFYEQIMDVFPEMKVHERYWSSLDRYGIMGVYPKGWAGIFQYIEEQIEDAQMKALARQRVEMCRTLRRNQTGGSAENFYGFPVLYVFKTIVNGTYKRVIQPLKSPTKAERDYEQQVTSL